MDSPLFRPAALAASACTAVQAGAWFVLSLMALLTSVEVLGPTTLEDAVNYLSVTGQFNLAMISCYFPRSVYKSCCISNIILKGDALMGVSIVYLLGSLTWICSSTLLLLDLMNKQKNAVTLTLTWAGVTWSISLLDFVVAILFGIDYHNIVAVCDAGVGNIYASVAGMLMSLSARGYVLWVLNVVAASLLFRAAIKESSDRSRPRRYSDSSNSTVYNSPADALQDSRSMVFQSQPQQHQPWVTSGSIPRSRPVSTAGMYPPLKAWDGGYQDGGGGGGRPAQASRGAPPPPRGPPPPAPTHAQAGYGYPDVQRGGLAARMTQGPSSQYGSQRGPAPATAPQQLPRAATGAAIPEPDYDAGHAPRRSALKKAPSNAAPARAPAPPADWRQPQSARGWPAQQPQVPMSPDGSGGWGPSTGNRWGGGHDNRGWQDGGGGDRWASRTGF